MHFHVKSIDSNNKLWEAVVAGGASREPQCIFVGVGINWADAIGQCVINNREALGVTFDVYDGDTLVAKSTVYGQSRD